jgi:formylglycine-generating enzyme required for sulfatase activity
MKTTLVVPFLVAAAACLSCTDLPAVGDEGQPCSDKGKCRKGLECGQDRVCNKPGAVHEPDAGGSDAAVDAAVLPDVGDAGEDAGPLDAADAATDGAEASDVPDAGPIDTGADVLFDDAADAGDMPDTADGSFPDAGCAPDCNGKCGSADDGCGGTCQAQCGANLSCQGGKCVPCGEYAGPCCASDPCDSPNVCNNGTCVRDTCEGMVDFTLCSRIDNPDRSFDICVGGTCVSPGCGDATCNPPGPNSPLADTGQRSCYDDMTEMACPQFPCNSDGTPGFCGQDWQYGWDTTHLASDRFTRTEIVLAETVVRDEITGLEWQGCPAGLKGSLCSVGTPLAQSWTEALAYCDSSSWAGYSDWRLPDISALVTLADFGRSSPAADPVVFPQMGTADFWSSTVDAGDPSTVWSANFATDPRVTLSGKSAKQGVYCVRGIGIGFPERFKVSETKTSERVVFDTTSGLTWQGCPSGLRGASCDVALIASHDWAGALKYCESLRWGNFDDWRLPNVKELFSILDLSRHNPAVNSGVFPANPTSLWSSTSFPSTSSSAWRLLGGSGRLDGTTKTELMPARCVRDGMVTIPSGPFMMGCNVAVDTECKPEEYPYHEVTVPTFMLDRYEVTAAEYKACVDASVCSPAGTTPSTCNFGVPGRENHPINCVDWNQAAAYCAWAGKRLPTEAEWEKAARGTDGRKYPWGNVDLDCDHAVHSANGCVNATTAPIGSKPAGVSPYGALDMVGNVYEWVEDDFHDSYSEAPTDGSAWTDNPRASSRAVRGGDWGHNYTYDLRASFRGGGGTTWSYPGFRCALR